MFLSAIFILAIIGIYIVSNRYNKLAYIFSLYFVSISGLLAVTAIYISKVSHYSYTFEFDYRLFLMLSKIKLSVFTLARMYNYLIALYMLVPIVLNRILNKTNLSKYVFLLLPIIYYILINDPITSWELFRLSSTNSQLSSFFVFITPYIFKLNNLLMYIYSIMPVYIVVRKFFQTKLEFKRRYYCILIVCISLISAMFIIVFNFLFENINGESIGFTKGLANQTYYTESFTLPLLIFAVVFTIVFVTLYFKPIYELSFAHKSKAISNSQKLAKNYKIMLHTYKNAFLSIEKISSILEKSIEKNDTATIAESINMLKMIASERTSTINQTLNYFKEPYIKQEQINLVECINNSITASYIESNIKIELNIVTENTFIYGDIYHLQEAFINVLNNASQSLSYNEVENPQITISIYQCEDYIIISIMDNGVGVTKSEKKKIFIPFYSSKSPTKNSGIGLSCVQRVIKLHNGHIQIKSIPDEFFDFQIILPQMTTESEEDRYEKNTMGNMR